MIGLDALLIGACPLIAYMVRFAGFDWSAEDWRTLVFYSVLAVPLKTGVFYALGLYRRLWSHTGLKDLEALVRTAAVSAAACAILGAIVLPASGLTELRVPYSVLFVDAGLTLYALAIPRVLAKELARRGVARRQRDARRALVAGAGVAGQLIVDELHTNPQLALVPVGFVDDDRSKHGHRLRDVPILGSLDDIAALVARHRIDEVIIAMPSAPGTVVRRVVQEAQAAGVRARTMPGMFDIIAGRVDVSVLREVRIEDLLRRAPVQSDLPAIRSLVSDRTVLVTGGGGSIGAELCRQLAALDPARLVLVGHGENSIFEIQNELRRHRPELRMTCAIADVRDGDRIRRIFDDVRPYAVFHAAAHKHVPLMEDNVVEAVTNNVLGTRNVVHAAAASGAAHFVFISTDKAVRPSSVMGASKRAAELVVQQAAAECGRAFVAVRFGNVLGSRGSVVPTFLRQIRAGGPVTITHPEMRRFFMTIPEAVQLVLQAASLGAGGEVFVLDMGEPVRILDLATDLIRLSGLEPGADIEVRCTGVRAGEKLYEEMFFDEENATPTSHPKVLRARNTALPAGAAARIETLIASAVAGSSDRELRALLRRVVPDFTSPAPSEAPATRRPARVERVVARPVIMGDGVPADLTTAIPPPRPALER
jgi:FlaA1/EpsC-like NDP-sugar epimerase